jgi:hypothetical protein
VAVTTQDTGYQMIARRREILVDLLRRQRTILDAAGLVTRNENLERLEQRVQSDAFKIMVLGVFKAGKSTCINAMLGQKVLPAFAVPTTAIINEIKWAEEAHAVLYPLEGEPQQISVDDLERYIVIDEEDDQRQNPYERAELFWPLELCRNGVELIDSPGLEEDEQREEITRRYLARADAVIFMFGNRGKLSMSEQSFFKAAIQPTHKDSVFFVCNRINEIEPEERDRTIRYTRRALEEFLTREDRLFFIDARGALRARLGSAEPELEATQVPNLERTLERFLSTERGRIKIITPARQLQQTVHEARETIQREQAMLDSELDELRRRYEEARGPLQTLEQERRNIVKQVDIHLQTTHDKVRELTRRFLVTTADRCLAWAEEVEPSTKPGLSPLKVQQQQEQMATEIAQQLGEKVQSAVLEWQEQELQPLVEQRAAELQQQIEDQVSQFTARVDQIRVDISGLVASVQVDSNAPTAMERVLSAAGALVLADVGSAYIGARSGFKPMARALLPQIAIGVAGLAIGLGPIGLPVLLLTTAAVRVMIGSKKAVKDLKRQLAEQLAKQLVNNSEDEARKVSAQVSETLEQLKSAIDIGLNDQLTSVHEEVQSVLAEKEKGEQHGRAKRLQLEQAERDLNQLDSELSELIGEAALR